VALSAPALMVMGLVTIVPTVVTELVTVTLTLEPVRMFWKAWAVRVVGLNWAASRVRLVFAEPAVVEKLADSQTIPEGVSVMVLVPLLYPGADTVIWAVPLPANACVEKPGTVKLPAVNGNVMDWLKGPAGDVARSRAAEPLVSVSVRLVGGAAPRPIDWLST
jgi:hypothetical protein